MAGVLDLTSALLLAIALHLYFSPFTKVEESFTVQAIHDILKYGVRDISKYDHLTFPGAVPRSFIGPLIISALAYPFNAFVPMDSSRMQTLVRFLIGMTNAVALNRFATAAKRALKREQTDESKQEKTETATVIDPSDLVSWFGMFTATQFHLMFYASRPLPNFVLALPLTLLGLAWALEENYKLSIILLSFTAIVFRLEIAALAVGVGAGVLLYKKLPVLSVVRTGFIGIGVGLVLSLQVDSYFWGRLTVPEIEAFIFNVIRGESAKWGTQPFFTYLTGYLPMMFFPPTVLLLNHLGFKVGPPSFRVVGIAAYFHILVLSLQPHKEWRFIIYANPPITLLGATAVAYLYKNMDNKSVLGVAVRLALLLTPFISLLTSVAFSYISSLNYPGGQALENFNSVVMAQNTTDVVVHLDVPVCMTGATLFGQLDDSYNVTYDKTEDDTLASKWSSFDYLITPLQQESLVPGENDTKWELVSSTKGFGGINTEFLTKTFTEQYANGLDLFVTWEKTRDLDFLRDIFNNAFIMKDVFYTYKKVPIL